MIHLHVYLLRDYFLPDFFRINLSSLYRALGLFNYDTFFIIPIGIIIGFFSKVKYVGRVCKYIGRVSLTLCFMDFFYMATDCLYLVSMSMVLIFVWKPFNRALRKKIAIVLCVLFMVICNADLLDSEHFMNGLRYHEDFPRFYQFSKNGIDIEPYIQINTRKRYFGDASAKKIPDALAGLPYIVEGIFSIQIDDGLEFNEVTLDLFINPDILEDNPIEKLWIARFNDDAGHIEHLDTTIEDSHTLSVKVIANELTEYPLYFIVNGDKYDAN